MVCSNEPGYYRDGGFGIRLENLVAVRPCAALKNAERTMYEFEALTLVPLDCRLFDKSLLTEAEVNWLNDYHQRVYQAMAPQLAGDDATLTWLAQATRAV